MDKWLIMKQEGNGVDLIYHTNNESGKTEDLAQNPDVNVAFLDSAGEWASISGKATVETDRAKVKEYYSPLLKAWLGDLGDGKHDGGPDDPRIGLIKVKAETIQYAVSRKNMITSTIDIVKGAVTGEVPAVNKLRHLSTEEIQQCKSKLSLMSTKASQADIFSRASFCLSQWHQTTYTTPDVYDLTEEISLRGNLSVADNK